jgi:serine/threonine-protein kinase
VRITPQLIRVSDDTHIWSERYDRVIDDIFTIQSDIAEKVIKQLHVTLLEPERRVLEAKPTENLDAYQAYLRGIDFAGRPDYAADDFRLAIQMFERAVKLDPAFALAHAELSMAHSSMYFHGHDRTEGRLSEAKKAVDRAFELRADLPEGHLALGLYYYRGHNDWDRALAEFAAAENDLPNDTRLLAVVAAIKKRQGHMEAAVEHFKKAYEWSPRDAGLPHEIGCAYMTMRNYSEAERYYDRSISLAPDQILAYICKAWNYWLWRGDVISARTTLEAMPKRFQSTRVHKPDSTFECVLQELYVRDYRAALDVLSAASVVFDEGQWWFTPKAQFEAHSYELIGDHERAFSSYDAARGLLEREVGRRPNDDRVHSALGIAYAGVGRTEDAIREGRLGVELVPVSKNAVIGPFRLENLALIYTMVGELDLALDQIECLLSIPAWFSVSLLRIDPRWDPLREHPRFQSLLERHSPAGS